MIKIFSDNPYWYSNGAYSHGRQILEENNEYYLSNAKVKIRGVSFMDLSTPMEPDFTSSNIALLFANGEYLLLESSLCDEECEEYDVPTFCHPESADELKSEAEECYGIKIKKLEYIGSAMFNAYGIGNIEVFLCREYSGEFAENVYKVHLGSLDEYPIGRYLEGISCDDSRFVWGTILAKLIGEKAFAGIDDEIGEMHG